MACGLLLSAVYVPPMPGFPAPDAGDKKFNSRPVTPISLHLHCNHVVVALTSNELIRLLTTTYVENQCDGLFLPLIDNLGVKLLVPRIVAAIENR